MATTQVSGSQIQRAWQTVAGIGLVITALTNSGYLFAGKNPAGIITFRDLPSGAREMSGSLLVQSGANTLFADAVNKKVGVGTISPDTKLEVIGAVSGSTIYAADSVRSSGAIVAEGAISGASLYAGTSIKGAGLATDCDTAGTSKLLWDLTTGRFSCGTDTDTNTTYTGGQGIGITAGVVTLNAAHSGSVIKASTTLASSGTVVWEGAASGASLYVATSIQGSGLTDCDTATQTLAWDATTGRFSCGTDSDTTYTAGRGLGLNGTVLTLNSTITGSLVNFTTVSGSVVKALNSLNSSGTLVFEGAASGSSLYLGTSLKGAGLTSDCDTAGTSKLLWDLTSGRFSCGTDTDTNTTYTAGQGLSLISTSFKLNSTLTGTLINFTTVSGSVLKAVNSLNSSGTLVFEGAASGSSLYLGASLRGAGLTTDCDTAGTSKLLWDVSTGRFSCGTDSNTTYTAGKGLSLNGTAFSLNTTITGSLVRFTTVSGSTVYGNNSVTSSGTITAEGTISGANLYIATSLQGLGLTTCSNATTSKLLWNSSSGRFSCGTDQTGAGGTGVSSGNVITIGDARFVNAAGDTMTGVLAIQNGSVHAATNTPLLNIRGTASGKVLFATNELRSSGTLLVEGVPRIQRIIAFSICDPNTACATGSGGQQTFRIPAMMSGFTLTAVTLDATFSGTTGTMNVQFKKMKDNTTSTTENFLTTTVSLDSAERSSDTAAAAAVITNATVNDGDVVFPYITAVHTTPAKGVTLNALFVPQ